MHKKFTDVPFFHADKFWKILDLSFFVTKIL